MAFLNQLTIIRFIRTFITLLLLILFSQGATGQQVAWTELTPIGSDGVMNSVGVATGGKGYVRVEQVDEDETYVPEFWEYDPATDNWTRLADFPGDVRRRGAGFAIDGKVYYGFGSLESGGFSDEFWEYNPATDTWTQLDNFPGSARRSPVAFELDGKGYMGTGWSGSRNRDFWEYDPATDTWTQKATFPGSGREVATGFSLDGNGYIGTGFVGGGSFTDDFWKYDPAADEWTQIADFGGSVRVTAVSFTADGHAYVGTGQEGSGSGPDPSNFMKDLWKYHPEEDMWTEHFDFPGAERNWPFGFSIDGIGYLGGGRVDGGATNDFWRFDPGIQIIPQNLTPDYIDPSVVSIESGNVIQIDYKVDNTGIKDISGPWKDGIYLSETQSVDNDAILIETVHNNFDLPEGDHYSHSVSAFIPEDLSGDYWVMLKTDKDGDVQFEDTSDNIISSSQQISITLPPRPELEVTSVTVPASASSGETIEIQWTVQNTGAVATQKPWSDYIYWAPDAGQLSDENQFDPNETFVTSVSAPVGLAPNETYTSSAEIELPLRYSGSRYYMVFTNKMQSVKQNNFSHDNNSMVSDAIAVQQTPLPDLIIEDFFIQGTVFSGSRANFSYTVKNQGNASTLSNSWTDRIIITKEDVPDERNAHRVMEIDYTQGLDADSTYTISESVHVGVCVFDTFNVFVQTDFKNETFELNPHNNTSFPDTLVVTIEPKPDLIVNYVDVLTSPAWSGQNMDVAFEVENDGFETAWLWDDGWSDRIYLSRNETFHRDSVRYIGGAFREDSLQVGESYVRTVSANLPDTAIGEFYVYVYTDNSNKVCEAPNDDNNVSRYGPIDIQLTPPPDLVVDNISHIPDAVAGEVIDFTYTVRNIGPGIAEGSMFDGAMWKDRAYLVQTDVEPHDTVHTIAHRERKAALEPNDSYSESVSRHLFTRLESGEYVIYVHTDYDEDIYEHGNEGNNVTASNTFNIHRDPTKVSDLSVKSLSLSGEFKTGQEITVEYEVENLSKMTNASSWYDKIYLVRETGNVVEGWAVPVFGALDKGESYEKEVNLTLPHGRQGNYSIMVVTDTNHSVLEYNLHNNSRSESIFIELSPPPDLIVDNIIIPDTGRAGQMLNIEWSVGNIGNGAAVDTPWTDAVYLSENYLFGNNAIRLERIANNNVLAPSAFVNESVSSRIPLYVSGDYYVIVRIDEDDDVYEHINTANNTNHSVSRVHIFRPEPADLKPVQASISYSNNILSYTVENIGQNPAVGTWNDVIYLSEEPYYTEDAIKLAEVEVDESELLPTENYQEDIYINLPFVQPGEYYFVVKADAFNYIPETDLSNNEQASGLYYIDQIPELPMDSVYADTFRTNHLKQYYKVNRPAETGMIVDLIPESGDIATELYHRKELLPNRITYDNRHDNPNRPEQRILVPSEQESVLDFLLTYGNNIGRDQHYDIIAHSAEYSIIDINPPDGGEHGNVSIHIRGFDFTDSMQFVLAGANDTIPAFHVYVDNTTSAVGHFNLRGNETGDYDIMAVRYPGGDTAVLEDAFEITEHGLYDGYAMVHQPSLVRPGQDFDVQVTFGNRGSINRYDNLLLVAFASEDFNPDAFDVSYTGSSIDAYYPDLAEHPNPPNDSNLITIDGITFYLLWIPALPSQSTGDLTFRIKDPAIGRVNSRAYLFPQPLSEYSVTGKIEDLPTAVTVREVAAVFTNHPGLTSAKSGYDCDDLNVNRIKEDLLRETLKVGERVHPGQIVSRPKRNVLDQARENLQDEIKSGGKEALESYIRDDKGFVESAKDWLGGLMPSAEIEPPPFADQISIIGDCVSTNDIQRDCFTEHNLDGNPFYTVSSSCCPSCDDTTPDNGNNRNNNNRDRGCLFGCTNILPPIDPNEIVGPEGITDMRFIEKDEELTYTIYFENLPDAGAPANEVIIENPLQEHFRLQDFKLKEVAFGDTVFEMPPTAALDQTFPLGDAYDNVSLQIVGGLNVFAHEAFWRLTTLDRNTGAMPVDPSRGFLPPNDSTGRGEGHVTYTIKLDQPAVAHGMQIDNQAKIFFDKEAPIKTNIWTNIVGDAEPFSFVNELPEYQDNTSFEVEWTGIDGDPFGVGIKHFDVFYAKDDGEYRRWQWHTTENNAVFEGEMGHTYRFYSIAYANDGKVEGVPQIYEAITTLDETANLSEEREFDFSDEGTEDIVFSVYPNPSKDVTNLLVNLPAHESVELEAWSMTGRYMGSVYSGQMNAGNNIISLNPAEKGWEHGIYFISLKTGNHTAVKKLIFME